MNLGYVSESSSQRKSASSLITLLIGSISSTWISYKRKIWTLEFREQVADFCFYILSHSKAKTLSGGITVNGPHESLLLSFLTWTFLLPIIDNRSGRQEDYFWQMQSLMMPRKNHHKGHTVNFTYELKLFLVLSSIHRSRMNKEKELES